MQLIYSLETHSDGEDERIVVVADFAGGSGDIVVCAELIVIRECVELARTVTVYISQIGIDILVTVTEAAGDILGRLVE